MVVQRGQAIPVGGHAAPGAAVWVSLARHDHRQVAKALADDAGHWRVTLDAVDVGGPMTLEVEAGPDVLRIDDVLAGDVWLISGQSNMEHRVGDGVSGPRAEPVAERFAQIRTFKVPQRASETPQTDLDAGGWLVCSPASVAEFSAVGFYFARRITELTGVPIGLLEASWGGSTLEAWCPRELLADHPHKVGSVIPEVERGEWSLAEARGVSDARATLLLRAADESQEGIARGVLDVDHDDSGWSRIDFPLTTELPREIAWLRRTFDWDDDGPAVLALGRPQDRASVYLNGRSLGRCVEGEMAVPVPPGVLRRGRNVLVLRLAFPWWHPSLEVEATRFGICRADGNGLQSLLQGWRIDSTLEPPLPVTYALQNVNAALYNGMVAPLLGTALRGVLYYQGEANWDNPQQYARLFPAFVADWRRRFGQELLPFYFVQIANFGPATEAVQDRSSAHLRAAQAEALALPGTGMVVTLDVGEALDIHPKNKVDVGERLARHALRDVYGHAVVVDGPRARSVVLADGKARVLFAVGSALTTRDGQRPRSFALAGADGRWHTADARIEGDAVVLSSRDVPHPAWVRYAWSSSPVVNLCDAEGLPAAPFRSDDFAVPF